MEGLWLQLLRKVDLIDGFDVTLPLTTTRTITLRPLHLGQFRDLNPPGLTVAPGAAAFGHKEHLSIKWSQNGEHVPEYDDQLGVTIDAQSSLQVLDHEESERVLGNVDSLVGIEWWEVEVQLTMDAIRKADEKVLRSKRLFVLGNRATD